ncbi:sensor domain-containing diguanylate cyclase [PVC group bacterium]|nr:sensor domain-containing diguanylate cyclase [PVC group bacterium]
MTGFDLRRLFHHTTRRSTSSPARLRLDGGIFTGLVGLYVFVSLFLLPHPSDGFLKEADSFFVLFTLNLIIAVSFLMFSPLWAGVCLVFSFFLALMAGYEEQISQDIFLITSYVLTGASCFWLSTRLKKRLFNIELLKDGLEEDINVLQDDLDKKQAAHPILSERLKKTQVITEAAENINNSLELEKTLHLAVDIPRYILDKGNHILLFMYDYKRNVLELRASAVHTDVKESVKQKTGTPFDIWVAKNKQALIIQDVEKDFRFGSVSEDVKDLHLKSLMCVPLLHKSNLLGVLHIDSTEKNTFTPDDLRLFDIIANITALVIQNMLLFNKTKELATRDSLTNLFVHRHFHERLEAEWRRAKITETPLAIMIIDIDHFKKYNDTYGHLTGDRVLKDIAQKSLRALPKGCVLGRYGGDEFAAILPRTTAEEAEKIAQKLRQSVEKTPIDIRRMQSFLTVSIGIAVFPEATRDKIELLGCADKALYQAKKQGRNQVCLYM